MPQSKITLKPGLTLVEILLFLLIVLTLVTILLSSSGVLKHLRRVNLDTVATKIASCEIEELRKKDFAQLPSTGSIGVPCDQDLANLPAPKTATRTISDYLGDTNIKQITITVTWTEKGLARQFTTDTLISKYGI